MKINENHLAGYIRRPKVIQMIIESQQTLVREKMGFNANNDKLIEECFTKVLNPKVKSYILRQTTQTVISRIQLGKSFDPGFLVKLPHETIEIILNENALYRFSFDGDWVRGVFLDRAKIPGDKLMCDFGHDSFGFQPSTGVVSVDQNGDLSPRLDDFIRIIVFLYFSDIKTIILQPKGKIGTLHTERFKNEFNTPFIIVDTNWNQISIRTEGFNVSGHFRLQPCGLNNESRKLIFIEEFQKHGYIRGAKKLQEAI